MSGSTGRQEDCACRTLMWMMHWRPLASSSVWKGIGFHPNQGHLFTSVPNVIATEAAVGVHVSAKYIFYIIVGPVGAYYPQGFNPVDIFITEKYTRAAVGGLGEAKTLANYAASLLAQREAQQLGYTQVLWLDAVERKYVEEVGTSNIFFYIGDELVTPSLTGTILQGSPAILSFMWHVIGD